MRAYFSSLAIVALSTLAITSCSQKRDTAMVLWIETDFLPADIANVHVQVLTDESTPSVMYDRDFPRIAEGQTSLPWSGSLVIAPRRTQPARALVAITLTPTAGHGTAFTVKADAPFARNEWRQLEVFLARQCGDQAVRDRCATVPVGGQATTCGSADPNNPCIPIRRESLAPFEHEAGVPDVATPVAFDVPTTMDATMDVPSDFAGDVSSDVPVPPEVQLRWPPYSARVSGGMPRFRARVPVNSSAGNVEVCTDLALGMCRQMPLSFGGRIFVSNGSSQFVGSPSAPLTAGFAHWRLSVQHNGSPLVSPWRPIFIGHANPTVSTAPHVVTGIVADLDHDGYGEAIHSIVGHLRGHPIDAAHSRIGVLWGNRGVQLPIFSTPAPLLVGPGQTSLAAIGDTRNAGEFSVFLGDSQNNRLVRFVFLQGNATVDSTPISAPANMIDFGSAQAPGGDINGDGISDLVVGSAGGLQAMTTRGAFAVYFGDPTRTNGLSPTPVVIEAPPSLALGARFGSAVSAVCDYNGDDISDIIVGAGNATGPGQAAGTVYLYLGGPTLVPGVAPTQTFTQNMLADFGNSVSCAGDMDNDGHPELIIGATASGGMFQIMRGNGNGFDPVPAQTITAPVSSFEQLGRSVAGGADIDGDGFDDVVVGAPAALIGGPTGTWGLVKIFFGGPNSMTLSTTSSFVMVPMELAFFGWSTAMVGPTANSNGTDCFQVGAPLANIHGFSLSGLAEVFSADRALITSRATQPGDAVQSSIGSSLARMN